MYNLIFVFFTNPQYKLCLFFAEIGELWDKVEVCSLLKALHVPIASHKVHYIGMEGGSGAHRDAQEHTQGVKRGRKDKSGLKISIFLSSYLVLQKQ